MGEGVEIRAETNADERVDGKGETESVVVKEVVLVVVGVVVVREVM